jgi:hypothetical protein
VTRVNLPVYNGGSIVAPLRMARRLATANEFARANPVITVGADDVTVSYQFTASLAPGRSDLIMRE